MALNRDDVVDAAWHILQSYGLGDLSMRRLAKELEVQPGALYWHVANKQELLAVLAQRMVAPLAADRAVLKIVCFDEIDLDWATETATQFPQLPLFLSAGTPVPAPAGGVREAVGERYRWLCERVAGTSALARARVLPQLHVIAWKEATGV